MSKGRKEFTNPYLFLLARRLLEYDFVQVSYEPSDLELAGFIYNRYKSENYADTKFTDPVEKRDSFASFRANSIYQHILKPKTYRFTEKKLDELVKEIRTLNTFSSWNEFYAEYGESEPALAAKISFFDEKVRNFHIQIYLAHVNIFILQHHISRMKCPDSKSLITISDKIITKSASSEECISISRIEQNASRIRKEVIMHLFNIKYSNDLSYVYCCIDHFTLMRGYLIFIPLKEDSYKELKAGNNFFYFLSTNDILEIKEGLRVKYIYVQINYEARGHSEAKFALKALKKRFVNILKNDLIFCTSFPPNIYPDVAEDFGFTENSLKFASGISFHEAPQINYPGHPIF